MTTTTFSVWRCRARGAEILDQTGFTAATEQELRDAVLTALRTPAGWFRAGDGYVSTWVPDGDGVWRNEFFTEFTREVA